MTLAEQYRRVIFGLDQAEEAVYTDSERGDIAVSAKVGDILAALVLIHQPDLIVEVGSLQGYSATRMATVMRPESSITCLEIDARSASATRGALTPLVGQRVTVIEADACSALSGIDLTGRTFIFLDGAKREYPDYLDAVIDRLAIGDVLVADDALAPVCGRYDGEPGGHDAARAGVYQYARRIVADARYHSTLTTSGFGLLISRRMV